MAILLPASNEESGKDLRKRNLNLASQIPKYVWVLQNKHLTHWVKDDLYFCLPWAKGPASEFQVHEGIIVIWIKEIKKQTFSK